MSEFGRVENAGNTGEREEILRAQNRERGEKVNEEVLEQKRQEGGGTFPTFEAYRNDMGQQEDEVKETVGMGEVDEVKETVGASVEEKGLPKSKEEWEKELLSRREQLIQRNREIEEELRGMGVELEGGESGQVGRESEQVEQGGVEAEETGTLEDGVGMREEWANEPKIDEAEETGVEEEETAEMILSPEMKALSEKARETIQKAKKKTALKRFMRRVAVLAMVGLVAFGGASIFKSKNENNANGFEQFAKKAMVATEMSGERLGIYDGYGEKGMWMSENKTWEYDYACGREVMEVTNDDAKEAIKYTAKNQVESFADYLAHLPEELQPEGYKGLSIAETEAKLEGESEESYAAIRKYFNDVMDRSSVEEVELNGNYDNSYMRMIDENGDVVHGNMKNVKFTTNENGTKATKFYWTNEKGEVVGYMLVRKDCLQGVSLTGAPIYRHLERIEVPGENTPEEPGERTPEEPGEKTPEEPEEGVPEKPSENTPEKPGENTPEEGIKEKDAENLKRIDAEIEKNLGAKVSQMGIDGPARPAEKPQEARPDGSYATRPEAHPVNEDAKQAENVQLPKEVQNGLSGDVGSGAQAQAEADAKAKEMEQQAPKSVEDLSSDYLKELGL